MNCLRWRLWICEQRASVAQAQRHIHSQVIISRYTNPLSPLLPHFQATLPIIPNAHRLGRLAQVQPVPQFRFVAIFARILAAANK
jgi:uncharacterized membrane protein